MDTNLLSSSSFKISAEYIPYRNASKHDVWGYGIKNPPSSTGLAIHRSTSSGMRVDCRALCTEVLFSYTGTLVLQEIFFFFFLAFFWRIIAPEQSRFFAIVS